MACTRSIGQTPWLLDIVWWLPLAGAIHRLVAIAGKMMETRLKAAEAPPFRDLVSYLVRPRIRLLRAYP